jgi:hypothetical protein
VNPSDGATIYNNPYGYKDGTYVRGSVDGTNENIVSTGAILMTDGVESIYIRGATWDETSNYVRFYAGDIGSLNSYDIKADGSGSKQLSDFFTVETLGDNYYKWTLTSEGKNVLYGRYYRISLVGAGENLVVTHGEPIPEDAGGSTETKNYTVTNTLTNVTSSNSVASVTEGATYTATLTAADGYEIDSVTVTMGGIDVTSTAYSKGSISIASVTGNIKIVAVATLIEEEPSVNYTNLVPTAQAMNSTDPYNGTGYKDNYRLSSSSPFESSGSGYVLTGYIPYPVEAEKIPSTIYIKGGTWNAVSGCRLYFFTEAKTSTCGPLINGNGSAANNKISTFYTMETLGDNYFRLVPIDNGSGKWMGQANVASVTDTEFFRISLAGSGANLIITLDEPIE